MHDIALLGLNVHANRLGNAYEKVQAHDDEAEMEFEFNYDEKALQAADMQQFKLIKKN